MDTSDHAPTALDAIDTVAFKVGLKGYNVDEVDEFLERLSGEVRQMKDLVHQQRQQLRQAAERIAQLESGRAPAPAPAPTPAPAPARAPSGGAPAPEEVASMIALAQRFIDQAQHEAQERSLELTAQAQERAKEIVAEARSRAEDEVNRLNGLKQRLSEDVERLHHQLDEQRSRITGVLSEFSRWVETSLGPNEPAARPRALSTPPAPPREPVPSSPTPPAPDAAPPRSSMPPRPNQAPPPAPPPTASQPTIGQMLRMDQGREDR